MKKVLVLGMILMSIIVYPQSMNQENDATEGLLVNREYLIDGKLITLASSSILKHDQKNKIKHLKDVQEPQFIINGRIATIDQFRNLNPENVVSIMILKEARDRILRCGRGIDGIIVISTRIEINQNKLENN